MIARLHQCCDVLPARFGELMHAQKTTTDGEAVDTSANSFEAANTKAVSVCIWWSSLAGVLSKPFGGGGRFDSLQSESLSRVSERKPRLFPERGNAHKFQGTVDRARWGCNTGVPLSPAHFTTPGDISLATFTPYNYPHTPQYSPFIAEKK